MKQASLRERQLHFCGGQEVVVLVGHAARDMPEAIPEFSHASRINGMDSPVFKEHA